MDEFPGMVFRGGAMGRRAGLVAGPDVWEVARAIRSARATEPQLAEHVLLELVSGNTGVRPRLARLAIDYWAAYPAEVDALIDHADRIEAELLEAADRKHGLLHP